MENLNCNSQRRCHDIGKNLVDIILTNNGYDVINLGIKQDVSAIIDAKKTQCRLHRYERITC